MLVYQYKAQPLSPARRHLKRTRRDDNIVSPQGFSVAKKNESETTKTQKCHTVICEPESNKGTCGNQGSPQPKSLKITECIEVAFWTVALSQQAMKSVKLCCCWPVPKKRSSTSSYANLEPYSRCPS